MSRSRLRLLRVVTLLSCWTANFQRNINFNWASTWKTKNHLKFCWTGFDSIARFQVMAPHYDTKPSECLIQCAYICVCRCIRGLRIILCWWQFSDCSCTRPPWGWWPGPAPTRRRSCWPGPGTPGPGSPLGEIIFIPLLALHVMWAAGHCCVGRGVRVGRQGATRGRGSRPWPSWPPPSTSPPSSSPPRRRSKVSAVSCRLFYSNWSMQACWSRLPGCWTIWETKGWWSSAINSWQISRPILPQFRLSNIEINYLLALIKSVG